jgi:two-component system, OmpR family, KDP operon response regulator KdpE
MKEGAVILIIDDEAQIRRFLRITLEANGYQVHEAKTGQEGLSEAHQLRPDLVILDLGLPDMDGSIVLQKLREWTTTPVIMLSVRDSDTAKIAALDAGADDYLTKPFSVGELLARLRVAQRHNLPTTAAEIFENGPLLIDLTRHTVALKGQPLKLTNTEYALIRMFVLHAGQTLTHRQILREVWGPQYVDETHYLRVYIAQLRQKLEADPARPTLILTEPGVGYRLNIAPPANNPAE